MSRPRRVPPVLPDPVAASYVDGRVTVTVPATSANLGPGFDSLGLALDLRDTLVAEVTDGPLEIVVEGEGTDDVPLDPGHLVHRAMVVGFEWLGVPVPALSLRCRNVIPHARGLGSSSAAIVGGLVLARALVLGGARILSDTALLDLANALEGHPDNVAPALLGGFTVAVTEDGRVAVARLAVADGIGAVAFVPPAGVETKVARGLLPAVVPHADAAANAGRTALLVAALTGDPTLLMPATRDWLHQEYRRPAMPGSLALVDALRADGVAAVVSGAGPTVLALLPTADVAAVAARVP
ncbi:MAG: homoserine kinase, partial [Nocardioidaceae bacterium]|nr:homoserine kinase [Nocardioidaceae bacterium]